MPNNRILAALDQLAGVAGEEIDQAAKFRYNEALRQQAMQKQQEQLDRQFNLENQKLNVMRGELKLAQKAESFKEGNELATKDSAINSLKNKVDQLNYLNQLTKMKYDIGKTQFDEINALTDDITTAYEKGESQDAIAPLVEMRRRLESKYFGEEITPKNLDFGSSGTRFPPNYQLSPEGTDLTLKYQDRAAKYSSDYETVRNNLVNIEAATKRMISNPDNINRIATDQAVITSFNKILDPTSVVRESEYARTPANTSLINRAKGAIQKLSKGGAGLTQADITEIRDTAREMAELRRSIINKKLENQIRKPAAKRGLDPEEIAPLYQPINIDEGTGGSTFMNINNKAEKKANNADEWLKQQGY